ncbi:MAG: glycosyltransferase family 2 protein [Bacteroidales bacterium]|nr:glycosyltransferase family 2 protein [Bacteroidales bacterium]
MNILRKKVSAIICVYNEETTICNVIKSVSKTTLINEIIIVNDGSTDKTDEILKDLKKQFPFRYIVLQENKGKGYAMATGVENAQGEIIVFVDADLSNLSENHINKLIEPLLHDNADMVLGFPSKALISYKINLYRNFTGERALFKKEIKPIIGKIRYSQYGVEWLINHHYKDNKKRVVKIYLQDLYHPSKYAKNDSFLKATKELLIQHKIILKTVIQNNLKNNKIINI